MGQFEQTLEEELDYRNRQLLQMKLLPIRNRLNDKSKKIYLHYIIPILYAFWEGYMKFCITHYIETVCKIKDIRMFNKSFVAYVLNNMEETKLTHARTNFSTQCQYFENMREAFLNSRLPPLRIEVKILSYKYLKKLLMQMNLIDPFERYKNEITKLIRYRNDIVHGENQVPYAGDDFLKYADLVQTLNNHTLDIFIDGLKKNDTRRNCQ